MKQKALFKIISIVSAIALLLSSLGIFGSATAATLGGPEGLDLQAIVDSSDIKVDNSTELADLQTALKKISLPTGYTIDSVTEFYKMKAIQGAVEKGSTYDGAVDGEVLVDGEKGYISAAVSLKDSSDTYETLILLEIEAPMTEYSFASVSKEEDFFLNTEVSPNRWEYRPEGGVAAEKVVIPETVFELTQNWYSECKDSVKANTRCVVYGKNITVIPVQGDLEALEVVSFKGDVTELSGGDSKGAFSNSTALKAMKLPETVKILGQKALYNCTSLTSLYLPEGLETIGKELLFSADKDAKGHNITEITIPSTVLTIGQHAFRGTNVNTVITVLSQAARGNAGIHAQSFARSTDKSPAELRITKDGNLDSNAVFPKNKTYLEDSVTVTEAAVRAAKRIEKMQNDVIEGTDSAEEREAELRQTIAKAYGSVSTFVTSWKNYEFEDKGLTVENTIILSDGEKGVEIPFSALMAKQYDLQSIVDASDLVFYNDVTERSLLESLSALDTGDFTIDKISDFYKMDAIEGAIEVGSTYKGAVDGEILVPGEKGYLTAVVKVTAKDGTPYIASLILDIEPTMAEYSFSSVSSEKDFTYNDAWWGLRWEYHPMNGEGAEKIVIPDKVKELKVDWHQSYIYSMSKVRCIVYNEHITSIPSTYNFYNLEVVSIRGPVTSFTQIYNDGAFRGCSKLKHIRLPDTLKSISRLTFLGCTGLTQLYLPEGLETIEGELFGIFENGDIPGYNIQQITIPSTVKKIGKHAFVGANKDTEITVLTEAPHDDGTGIHTNAFFDTDFNAFSNKITLRVVEGSGAASSGVKSASRKKLYINDEVEYTEAAARAKQRVEKLNGIEATAGEIAEIITASYGKASGFNADWENKVWEKSGEYMTNNWVISKNGALFKIRVEAKLLYADLQKAVDESSLTCTNDTDERQFRKLLTNVLPSGYNIEKMVQFYKVNAVDGAVDITDGKNEVLVKGLKGSVEAIVEVMRPDGKIETVYVEEYIEPVMAEYTFGSVSEESDFVIEGGVLKSYSGSAEKVVIPEGVTSLADNWLGGITAKQTDYNGEDTVIKCIVYPESLEGTVPDQNNLKALQVAAFKGDKVTKLGEKAFFGAENLKYINLPAHIETIGKQALATGTNLKAIYLPDGLKTIEDYAFSWSDGSAYVRHGLVEITIPESVTSIGKNAFAYAKAIAGRETFTVTVLNDDIPYSEGMFAPDNAKVVVRALSKGDIYKSLDGNSAYTLVDLKDMTLVEAAARANVKHNFYSRYTYGVDITPEEVALELVKSYADHSSFEDDWKNSWDTSTDAKRYGTLYITDGEYTIGVSIDLDVPPEMTLEDIVSAAKKIVAEEIFYNSDDIDSYKEAIEAKMPGKYKIEIIDFNMQRAIDGAKDNTGVLVAGHNGSIASIIRLTDYYGNSEEIVALSTVAPTIEEYSFASTSQKDDFVLSDDGKVLLEYYGKAEKVVVPEGVERIASGWMWSKPYGIKALVLPESLKVIGDSLCNGMVALEVVSMKDGVISVGGNTFNGCYSLKYVHLSENIERISNGMFQSTYSLLGIRIPDSVKNIDTYAFCKSGLRDITVPAGVGAIASHAIEGMLGSEAEISTSAYPINDTVRDNVYNWLAGNNFADMPFNLTILSEKAKVDTENFGHTDKVCPLYNIRAYSGSESYSIVEKLIASTKNSAEKWKLSSLDVVTDSETNTVTDSGMSFVEALARAGVAADSLMLYNDMTADDIIGAVKDSFVQPDEAQNVSWSKALSITKATDTKNGAATGALKLSFGTYSFEIDINSTVYKTRPELSDSDLMDDFWGDDMWDEDLFEDEELEDFEDDFFDDELTDDIFEDVILDDEPTEDIIEDTVENDTKDSSKKDDNKKPASSEDSDEFPWILVIIGGAAALLLILGGIILLIILKKKKKKQS